MIRPVLIALAIAFPATWSVAQTVEVRAGDHDGFTRLVFGLPEGANWDMQPVPSENAYVLSVSGVSSFELATVFSRIGRDQVADVRMLEDAQSLRIEMACQCVAETSLIGRNMLIVDIASGAMEAAPEPEVVDPSLSPGLELAEVLPDEAEDALTEPKQDQADNNPQPLPDPAELAQVRTDGNPGIGPAKVAAPLMPGVPLVPGKDRSEPSSGPVVQVPLQVDPRPVSIGEQVIADLAAAATQGLLQPAVQKRNLVPIKPTAEPEKDAIKDADLAQQLVDGLAGLDHEAVGNQRLSIGGVNCVSDKKLRVADWGLPDDDVFEALSETRSAVFGEFDRVDHTTRLPSVIVS